MEEYIVANYTVYAFLLVLMWRQQLVASYVARFEKEHAKGVAGRRKSFKSLASAQAEGRCEWLGTGWCCSLVAVGRQTRDGYKLLFSVSCLNIQFD